MLLSFVKKYRNTILLTVAGIAISVFESNSNWVERYYYNGIYPGISQLQRWLTGWLPFSLGDLIYVLSSLYFIILIGLFIRRLLKEQKRWAIIKRATIKTVNLLLLVYIIFKLLWALNYSRDGVASQLKLGNDKYCKEQLVELIEDLIFEANRCRREIKDTALPKIGIDSILKQAQNAYNQISKQYNFLAIERFSIKPSLFSVTGNYLGYTGYYNPFTGEAQIRNDIPEVLLPFVTCHEVAHQLGYASEDEANFISYLVISKFDNSYFRYSMCLEILDYALNDLFLKYCEDFDAINGYKKRLQIEDCFEPQVKNDRKAIKLFFIKNKKKISNISSVLYDQYLKINYQKQGINSYNNVVQLILEYKH